MQLLVIVRLHPLLDYFLNLFTGGMDDNTDTTNKKVGSASAAAALTFPATRLRTMPIQLGCCNNAARQETYYIFPLCSLP